MQGIQRTGFGQRLGLLTEGQVEQIHEGALHVLGHTGLVIHDTGVLSLLERAGCPVSQEERRARLPANVVLEAIKHAPPVVKLYTRTGELAMSLGEGAFHARVSSGATGMLDLDGKSRREPTCGDLAQIVRLGDALPRIHGMSTMAVQPADVPVDTVDVHAIRIALENTVKPLGYVCLNPPMLEPVLEMAAVAAGGERELSERPIITALAESTSPLQLVSSQLAVVRAFASRRLPLTLHAHPMAGFTAPVTLAGELVITHAEIMALATIAQLINPGAPIVYGMSSSVPDMRSGANLSGAVEIGLLGLGVLSLAKHLGIPCLMSTGSDAHEPGAQSIMERVMTLLPPALAGIDLVNLTTLGTKMSFSLEQMVIDDMILGYVERYGKGITVDDTALALDLIHQVGPAGAFITTEHTIKNHRKELSIPGLVSRETRDAWEALGRPDIKTRAGIKTRQLLEEHRPTPLPAGQAERLAGIIDRWSPRPPQGGTSV